MTIFVLMPRQPKEGAKDWTLKIAKVPIDLYWLFHGKALSEHMELGKWVLKVLKAAAKDKNDKRAKS